MKRFLPIEIAPAVLFAVLATVLSQSCAPHPAHDQAALNKHIAAGIIARARTIRGNVLASAAQDGTIQLYNAIGEPMGSALAPPDGFSAKAGEGAQVLTALALSPEGNQVLSAYANGVVFIRDAQGGSARRIRPPGGAAAGALAMGRDFIAAGFETGEIALMTRNGAGEAFKTRRVLASKRTGAVRRLLISPDGKKLVSAGDDDLVTVHSIASGANMAALRVTGAPVSSLAFDASGENLFVATEGDGLRVYGPGPAGSFSLRARAARGAGLLAVAHKKDYIAAATYEGPILLFKSTGSAPANTPLKLSAAGVLRGHLAGAVVLAFNNEGLVSAARDDSIRRWKLDGTPIQAPYLGHPDRVRYLAFAPKAAFIAAALGGNGVENAVWLWNPAGKLMARHRGHEQDVDCLAISPDGRRLASGSSDNTIRLTTLTEDGRALGPSRVLRDHERRITRLDFSPDGRFLLSAAGDGTIRLRHPRTGAVLAVLRGHRGTVTRARFSADGRFILSGGGDRTLRLWPLASTGNGRAKTSNKKRESPVGEARVFKGHTLGITAAALSGNGEIIASAAWDRTMRIFHAREGLRKTIQLPEREWVIALAFHPRRRLIVGGGWDGGLRFWDYQGREIARVKDVHGGRVSALAFSPDGKVLATSSYDRTIRRHRLDDLLP